MLNHTSLLNEQKTQWEARGQDVYVEGQNSFRLRGQSATLAGRPDLIVVRNDDAPIIDIKACQKQPSHFVQIMIYMYALPRALPQYQHAKLAGEVIYPTRTVRVPMGSLHTQFIQNLGALIRRLAADKPPTRVPSRPECRFCDISAQGLPGAYGRRLRARRQNYQRLLIPHLASLPVRGTGETIAAVCPECRSASCTRQTQIVRPRRSNREIYFCPHLDHRSSADSLFGGFDVTTPSSRERDEHRRKTIGGSDSHRTAHRDAGRGTDTGSVRPAGDHGPHQSSDDDRGTEGPAGNGDGANRHTTGADGDCPNHGNLQT